MRRSLPQGAFALSDLAAPPRAGEYLTVVADPPWRYDNASTRGAAADHYSTMSMPELKALPVDHWTAPSAHLYLWTTTNFLPRAFKVLPAWGFEYVTNLVWVKPQIGMGNYFRISHEHVLFGVKKPRTRTRDRTLRSWFVEPRQKHSAKPPSFKHLVESASVGPYLEMFARPSITPGQATFAPTDWDYWGLDTLDPVVKAKQ